MDKLENIRYIKLIFRFIFQKEVQVDFSVEENCYRIGFDEYDLEEDIWAYLIYCYKDKFIKWSWETNRTTDTIPALASSYNSFTSCIEGIIDFEKNIRINIFSKCYDRGFFDE